MKNKNELTERLLEKTKYLFHSYYNGETEPWFTHLDKNAVYLGSGDPMLIGKSAIVNHFKKYEGVQTVILEEEYNAILQSQSSGMVYGRFVLGTPKMNVIGVTRFTIVYKIQRNGLFITHQHNSHEFKNGLKQMENVKDENRVDSLMFQFIRDVLSDVGKEMHFSIPSGNNTVFLNASMVLYVQSSGKRTEFVCIDRTVSCNMPISELKEHLPDVFYPVHRCYLVNVKHIHEIRRFEIEMISGVKIPIPAVGYMQIKEDLISRIGKQEL